MKTEDLISLAIQMRDAGIPSAKILRMCLFVAVLFAADCDYSSEQVKNMLDVIFKRTVKALNKMQMAEYLGKDIDEC